MNDENPPPSSPQEKKAKRHAKVRLIAEAQIKTDKISARALATLLRRNLNVLDALDKEIGTDEQPIRQDGQADHAVQILSSMPGIGLIPANVIATETDGIKRFSDGQHYTSYSGLSPTVHSSGGKTYTGHMVAQCNRRLKWAYVEAAWIAVGCSAYFGGLYRYHESSELTKTPINELYGVDNVFPRRP